MAAVQFVNHPASLVEQVASHTPPSALPTHHPARARRPRATFTLSTPPQGHRRRSLRVSGAANSSAAAAEHAQQQQEQHAPGTAPPTQPRGFGAGPNLRRHRDGEAGEADPSQQSGGPAAPQLRGVALRGGVGECVAEMAKIHQARRRPARRRAILRYLALSCTILRYLALSCAISHVFPVSGFRVSLPSLISRMLLPRSLSSAYEGPRPPARSASPRRPQPARARCVNPPPSLPTNAPTVVSTVHSLPPY